MPKWKRLWYVLGVLLVAFMMGGCLGQEREGARKPAEKQPKIAFSIADMQRDGNQAIKKIVTEAARKDGIRITWKDAKNDAARQEQDIQKLIDQKVDVVVLQFVEPQMGPGLVRRLAMNRIKVVTLETLPVNAPVDGYIASDHARAGELQARFVKKNMPRGGKVLILGGDPVDPMAQAITKANEAVLKDTPGFTVETVMHSRADTQQAAATVQKALESGTPGAVIASDSRMAVAAVEMLRKQGLAGQVVTAGVGANRMAAEALMAGEHDAEVDVRPDLLGRAAYEAAKSLARNETWNYDTQIPNGDYDVPAKIIPVRLITAENAFLLQEQMKQAGKKQQGGQKQQQQQSSGQSQQGQQGQQGQQQQKMTKLKITTQEGKTIEVEVPGEIKSITSESQGRGGAGPGGQGGGDGQGGGGS
ncbi:MAG: substrate-binding domain-containing protein [Peptococcaceae bacterium]|nr:substrate-binding domain-containing protein [Peptococcaceae bacterium]